jgi:hypothetical protein
MPCSIYTDLPEKKCSEIMTTTPSLDAMTGVPAFAFRSIPV